MAVIDGSKDHMCTKRDTSPLQTVCLGMAVIDGSKDHMCTKRDKLLCYVVKALASRYTSVVRQ